MMRVLHAGAYLTTFLLALSLLLLVVGLAMVARPELFLGLGPANPARTGLEMALVSGFVAIACAVIGRILGLLQGDADNA